MQYNRFDNKKFDDVVLKLAALGLLEIMGKFYQAEYEEYRSKEKRQLPSPEKLKELQREINRQNRRRKICSLQQILSPIISRVAIIFLVFVIGLSTVLVTSADAREYLYQLIFTMYERYSEVVIPEDITNTVESKIKYEITYIPDGFELTEEQMLTSSESKVYADSNNHFIIIGFETLSDGQTIRFDTENADIQSVMIGDSMGHIIKKDYTQIVWQNATTFFSISSNLPSETTLKIAQGIVQK